jgi:HAE1 family hydrophobic/amphiphilic exporter-1
VKGLYSSPIRVYLCLAALAIAGIFSGLSLPVSLFPNSSKPTVGVDISYGSSTASEFFTAYGQNLESVLKGVSAEHVEMEKLEASYDSRDAYYTLRFKWGTDPKAALREVTNAMNSYSSRFTQEVRDSVEVWSNNENSGFFAVSFFSARRSLDDVYRIVEPLLAAQASKVQDAETPEIHNPSKKEIRIELNPEKMSTLQLVPRDVERAINEALSGFNGGSVTMGTQQLNILMPKLANGVDDLNRIVVPTPQGQPVHLMDIAKVDYSLSTTSSRIFKTNGAPSVILFASPKPGGNVKRMSEDLLGIVRDVMKKVPSDIQYRVLVDPSEFIRDAVSNVFREVMVGALLAVVILFVFIGSFKNTVTAAIEIPLSMVLAFILMKFSGMNLNLISLGGLALSAGMNVDASVVVMENIFRHFEEASKQGLGSQLTFRKRLDIIASAVNEVSFSVIASTIASLVVFIPLAFTSDLSYAVLGDLAKTVVFSHGFSAFVALILVPTVRLHLMSRTGGKSAGAPIEVLHSPIEKWLVKLENAYGDALRRFVDNVKFQKVFYLGLAGALAILLIGVLPRLPKEIIGKPDTDWLTVGFRTKGNTLTRQMESQADEIEAKMLAKFGGHIQYTFSQVNGPNRAFIMARLKDKGEMRQLWKEFEAEFSNTPFIRYDVGPWNPAELPIPNPPQMRIAIRGGDLEDRRRAADEISTMLDEKQVYTRVWTDPDADRRQSVQLISSPEVWSGIGAKNQTLYPSDVADIVRVATTGRKVNQLMVDGRSTDVVMRYPENQVSTPEDIAALPIGIGSKLVPLKALADVRVADLPATRYTEDQQDLYVIWGRESESAEQSVQNSAKALERAEEVVSEWQGRNQKDAASGSSLTIQFEDAQKDMNIALKQLAFAVGLSILLIFLTLVIQFGSFTNAALVLVAVPLGLIGVLISLFVFRSTLSLNSVLGVILLNGISVANSIILVDFLKRKYDEGMSPVEAAVVAGRTRLRPILITSLTTILGMLPVALGLGEGGRILQPLGIAVSGGLWVSMGLTLFVAPALQVAVLKRQSRRAAVRDIGNAVTSNPVETRAALDEIASFETDTDLSSGRTKPRASEPVSEYLQ